MARAGLCSRRDAERWIEEGRVRLNGKPLTTAACVVTGRDRIEVDGVPLPAPERTRMWLLHKQSGQVTTAKDPEGRKTIFSNLPPEMPRVITVGRLDINTEGLLLLTNDGGLARVLELPSTGWLRRYRVRAHGKVTQSQLDELADGIAVDGVLYGSIEAELEREQGSNVWLTFAMREGKNREVKKVLAHLGLEVNRLIRISYGPFQLGDLARGDVREVRGRTLRDQLGEKLIDQAGANFDAPLASQKSKKAAADTQPSSGRGANGKPVQDKTGKPAKKRGARSDAKANPLARLTTKQPDRNRNASKPKATAGPRNNKSSAKGTRNRNADRRR